jgi:hypothetical protein
VRNCCRGPSDTRAAEKLTDGAPESHGLADAEMIARQVQNFNDVGRPVPRITVQMRLPAFRYAALDPYTWPPARK